MFGRTEFDSAVCGSSVEGPLSSTEAIFKSKASVEYVSPDRRSLVPEVGDHTGC